MSIFRVQTSVAAGAVDANLLNGSKFEFLARPAVITIYASQDTPNDIELDWTLGNAVVAEDVNPNAAVAAGVGLQAGNINRDTDGIGSAAGDAGDRIQVRARNTNAAAAAIVNLLVEINEL